MEHKKLGMTLMIMIALAAITVVAAYAGAVPMLADAAAAAWPDAAGWRIPWLIFVEITALPILIAAVYAWLIAVGISTDRAFTVENAGRLRMIALLAAFDAVYFFAGNAVLLICGMNHPGIAVVSLIPSFIGAAIAVAATVLSRLTAKAAALQDESDLTI